MLTSSNLLLLGRQGGRLISTYKQLVVSPRWSKILDPLLTCESLDEYVSTPLQVKSLSADPPSALSSISLQPMDQPHPDLLPEDAVVVMCLQCQAEHSTAMQYSTLNCSAVKGSYV